MSTNSNIAQDDTAVAQEVRELILKKYPAKVARKRAKQIIVNQIEDNDQP